MTQRATRRYRHGVKARLRYNYIHDGQVKVFEDCQAPALRLPSRREVEDALRRFKETGTENGPGAPEAA